MRQHAEHDGGAQTSERTGGRGRARRREQLRQRQAQFGDGGPDEQPPRDDSYSPEVNQLPPPEYRLD